MRSLTFAVGLFVFVVGGCSRPATPEAGRTGDGFEAVIDRLRAEARTRSAEGTEVIVNPPADQPDGSRVVTARRVRGTTTTEYTLAFRRDGDQWVCAEAVCEETRPGERTAHRIGGLAGIDQLLLWLAW